MPGQAQGPRKSGGGAGKMIALGCGAVMIVILGLIGLITLLAGSSGEVKGTETLKRTLTLLLQSEPARQALGEPVTAEFRRLRSYSYSGRRREVVKLWVAGSRAKGRVSATWIGADKEWTLRSAYLYLKKGRSVSLVRRSVRSYRTIKWPWFKSPTTERVEEKRLRQALGMEGAGVLVPNSQPMVFARLGYSRTRTGKITLRPYRTGRYRLPFNTRKLGVGINGRNIPGDLVLYIEFQKCGIGFIGCKVRGRDVMTASYVARGRITSWSKNSLWFKGNFKFIIRSADNKIIRTIRAVVR